MIAEFFLRESICKRLPKRSILPQHVLLAGSFEFAISAPIGQPWAAVDMPKYNLPTADRYSIYSF